MKPYMVSSYDDGAAFHVTIKHDGRTATATFTTREEQRAFYVLVDDMRCRLNRASGNLRVLRELTRRAADVAGEEL